jgi:uncharacterized membrane-anchored protein
LTADADVVSKGAGRARLIWLKSIGVARAISKENRNTKGTIMRLMHPRPGALRSIINFAIAVIAVSFGSLSVGAAAQEGKSAIKWQEGPGVAVLKNSAEVKLPKGYKFANAADTQKVLKAAGEPTSGREMGMIVPTEGEWSVFFEFSDTGYVKDDDKDKLDADKLLKSITAGNDQANKMREKMGNAPLKILGWEKPPFYDEATHNLEWALRAESEGHPLLNYNTRLLGRRGVMEVVLVCGPDKLPETLPAFKELLAGYSYKAGETYAEYKPGDKIAKYGLTALVAGGAVAVAAKTGLLTAILLLFKKAWKVIIIGLVAVASFFKRLLFGRSEKQTLE